MKYRCISAWCIHAFTASGAIFGLLALRYIDNHAFLAAFWCMTIAILIDAIDGFLARLVDVKTYAAKIDGALLDNMVDFFNYTLVPAYFILMTTMVPIYLRELVVTAIVMSSAYQFTQANAKTEDHFFKGFPSYWNIAVFYLFFWQMSQSTNTIILFGLAIMSFVPIKYIYPSRLDYLTKNNSCKIAMITATWIWGAATLVLLWTYPIANHILIAISLGYLIAYFIISLYRTWKPLEIQG